MIEHKTIEPEVGVMNSLEWLDAVRADLDALTRSRHIATSSGLTTDELTEAWKTVLSLEGHVATIAPDRLDRMERALRAVLALHNALWGCGNPRHTNPSAGCPECEVTCDDCGADYPCPTVTTIQEALSDE